MGVSKSATMPLKSFAKLMTFGEGKSFCELDSLLSSGNRKLPNTTAIFNMGSATHCPSFHKGLCKALDPNGKVVCYAMKAETPLYPEVLPYRLKQAKFWGKVTAEEFAWQFLCINALKELPYDKLRFNEASDFRTQACVDKAEKIAMYLKRGGIKTYIYTHRSDLDYTRTKHLVVNGSNFHKEGVPNTFYMVEDVKRDKPKGWSVCPMDCKVCDRCSKRGQKIVVPRH
jgi:hypothetical protein